jgi:hypothetical protein
LINEVPIPWVWIAPAVGRVVMPQAIRPGCNAATKVVPAPTRDAADFLDGQVVTGGQVDGELVGTRADIGHAQALALPVRREVMPEFDLPGRPSRSRRRHRRSVRRVRVNAVPCGTGRLWRLNRRLASGL